MSSQRMLLHVCCATCAAACVERLREEGYEIVLFYTNSNLDSQGEFEKRLEDTRRLAVSTETELIEDPYDHVAWLTHVAGLEAEPEQGARCRACFEFSLGRAAEKAAELGLSQFATTLTVSPHKSSRMVFEVGDCLEGFARHDFKKQDGFLRSLELSKQQGFYRQNYCGCEFSREEDTQIPKGVL